MADAQAAPAEAATTSLNNEPTTEATPINGDVDSAAQPNGGSAAPTADVETAGKQATTEVNAPEGDQKAEADVPTTAPAENGATKSKRKSSSGVPEHKSKKLNKKKSMPSLHLDLEPGDHVWARLKGHPPWPAVVCDEAMLPESLLGNRPVSTKRPDGSYREDFAEGGKNAKDRTYPVMFLSTNEFAWMINTAVPRLDPSECQTEGKKLVQRLKEAYELAAEQHDLDYYKDLLRQHEQEMMAYEKEMQEQEEQKAALQAEKEQKKADKERRKSKAADDDAMDVDGEEKPSKKRKKDAESEGEGKAKKTPKVKLSTKEPKTGEPAKKSKPKKKVAKPEEELEPELTPAERLMRREKAIFYLRHRLQRCFLSGETPPNADEMPSMAEFFTQLEQHKDLEPSIIRKTKIHKVLKNIVRLDSIPRDDEFNFKARSGEMLTHWNNALTASTDADTPGAEKPTTNGETKEESAVETKEDIKEPAEAPVEATNPGNAAGDEAVDTSMVDSSIAEVKTDKVVDTNGGAEEPAPETKTETPAVETGAD